MKTKYMPFLAVLTALVASFPALAEAADNPLGSPAASVGKFSENYVEAVRMALPPIDAADLAKVMERVRAATAAEKPLTITSNADLEKFFGLRSRDPVFRDFVDAGVAIYKLDPAAGRIYVTWRLDSIKPVARTAFAGQIKGIRTAHAALASRLGIPSEEIMFIDFREILTKLDSRMRSATISEIQSEGATTTFLRAVGGVLVEGSYLRVSSVDAKRLSLVKATWPKVHLADEATKPLRAPKDMLDVIAKRIATDSRGAPVNVHMAVVLRPVDSAKPGVFVPSLKIGVEPKTLKTADGYRTDAGQIYYSDLMQDSPPFADDATHDIDESAQR